MSLRRKWLVIGISSLLLGSLSTPTVFAANSIGKSCKNLGQVTKIANKEVVCKKTLAGTVWTISLKNPTSQKLASAPIPFAPQITAYVDLNNATVAGKVLIPNNLVPNNSSTVKVVARLYFGQIKLSSTDSTHVVGYGELTPISFTWGLRTLVDTLSQYEGTFKVEAEFVNENGSSQTGVGEVSNSFYGSTNGASSTPTASPTPSPTPSKSPTVAPSTKPSPLASTDVCSPPTLPSIPLASQRMAITKIEWKKDSNGYVSAVVTIRNDNSMNLRVVQFQFYYWYDFLRFTTAFQYKSTGGTTTVEHVFSADTPGIMGIENTPGLWLVGQSRSFLIDTTKILDCSRISMYESDYNVIQGIGG